jgi:hypothetical protein
MSAAIAMAVMRRVLEDPTNKKPDRRMTATFTWHDASRLKPGNANLPIGGLRDAIQENGVPGRHHQEFLTFQEEVRQ